MQPTIQELSPIGLSQVQMAVVALIEDCFQSQQQKAPCNEVSAGNTANISSALPPHINLQTIILHMLFMQTHPGIIEKQKKRNSHTSHKKQNFHLYFYFFSFPISQQFIYLWQFSLFFGKRK